MTACIRHDESGNPETQLLLQVTAKDYSRFQESYATILKVRAPKLLHVHT